MLYPTVKLFKVGSQLFTACGPKIIEFINQKSARVFLDLKFHDIPNTMVSAAKEALKYKVAMFTVHTLAGQRALKEVARVCQDSKTRVLGVTILTSISQHFLDDLGIKRSLSQEALYLAKMAKRCGLDGVVCSVHEATAVRKVCGGDFIIVTPGIRPKGADKDDQKRVATAKDAIAAGADYLVVGRPILEAQNSLKRVQEIARGAA
jgi:orotidine-5'-phosphate decarboxylase